MAKIDFQGDDSHGDPDDVDGQDEPTTAWPGVEQSRRMAPLQELGIVGCSAKERPGRLSLEPG